MNRSLTANDVKYLVSRLLENASEAVKDSRGDRADLFKSGRSEAYYEMLDILQSELDVNQEDLKEYGLDVNLAAHYV